MLSPSREYVCSRAHRSALRAVIVLLCGREDQSVVKFVDYFDLYCSPEATVPYRVRMRHGRTNDEDCLTGSRRELVAVLLALAATSSWWHACR